MTSEHSDDYENCIASVLDEEIVGLDERVGAMCCAFNEGSETRAALDRIEADTVELLNETFTMYQELLIIIAALLNGDLSDEVKKAARKVLLESGMYEEKQGGDA